MAASSDESSSSNEDEKELRKSLSIATKLVHPKTSVEDPYSASAPPLYQTATFAQRATEKREVRLHEKWEPDERPVGGAIRRH